MCQPETLLKSIGKQLKAALSSVKNFSTHLAVFLCRPSLCGARRTGFVLDTVANLQCFGNQAVHDQCFGKLFD
jgi:hypothetical protein